jgi:hypothetical protein
MLRPRIPPGTPPTVDWMEQLLIKLHCYHRIRMQAILASKLRLRIDLNLARVTSGIWLFFATESSLLNITQQQGRRQGQNNNSEHENVQDSETEALAGAFQDPKMLCLPFERRVKLFHTLL